MLKLSHHALILISGLIWFAIGFYLLQLGLGLLMGTLHGDGNYPLLSMLKTIFMRQDNSLIAIIAFSLVVGYFKGRYVLGKSARKGVDRILTFPNPTSLSNLYSAKYYLLLGAMVGLGISIKYFGLAADIRGLVDTAVGAALINGSVIYFRLAQIVRTGAAHL